MYKALIKLASKINGTTALTLNSSEIIKNVPDRLTTRGAASVLNLSQYTVRRYIQAGKLKAEKMNGLYVLNKDDVLAFRNANGTDQIGQSDQTEQQTGETSSLKEVISY